MRRESIGSWAEVMKWIKAAADEIITGAQKAMSELDLNRVNKMIEMILDARKRKIFIVGMGRSGFVGRAFALRLMNLGFNVYFLGETITPAATRHGDNQIRFDCKHDRKGDRGESCGHHFLS